LEKGAVGALFDFVAQALLPVLNQAEEQAGTDKSVSTPARATPARSGDPHVCATCSAPQLLGRFIQIRPLQW
jgi:hypothetical protein